MTKNKKPEDEIRLVIGNAAPSKQRIQLGTDMMHRIIPTLPGKLSPASGAKLIPAPQDTAVNNDATGSGINTRLGEIGVGGAVSFRVRTGLDWKGSGELRGKRQEALIGRLR